MQAVAKFGSAAERGALTQEVLPHLVDLARNPYGHFLVCKLLAAAPKQTLAGAFAATPLHTAALVPCNTRWVHRRFASKQRHKGRLGSVFKKSDRHAGDEPMYCVILPNLLQQQRPLRTTIPF